MRPLGLEMAAAALLAVSFAASLTGCSNLHIPFRQPPPPPLQPGPSSLEEKFQKQHQPQPHLPPAFAQAAPPALPPYRLRKARRARRSRREERNTASNTPPAQATLPPAPIKAPRSASAIGQLTAGDSATELKTRRDTETLILQTEHGLAGIKRRLTHDEQTTAGEIHIFLEQAKQALSNGDVEGANNLATKARLELDELTKQ